MKPDEKQILSVAQGQAAEERRFVVEVSSLPVRDALIPMPSPANRDEDGAPINGVNIGRLCQPLTAAALLDGYCRFYSVHPPIFSPVSLKIENPGLRDTAALRIYLRLTN
jgi:hypothetical protein